MTLNDLQSYADSLGFRRPLGIPMGENLSFSLLGQGEYNINYLFCHPITGHRLVLRKSTASQMHLEDQIGYEYRALQLLQGSGRTPRPVFLDSDAGVLVEQFLPGQTMDYRSDLHAAAECLAEIHSLPVPENAPLLQPEDSIGAMLAECREMAAHYLSAPNAKPQTCEAIRELLDLADHKEFETAPMPRCIINTELNSGNFLVDDSGKAFLIDWEKPILGEAAQDLGHFLAPTTTCWKTDVILTGEEKLQFLRYYYDAMEKTVPFEQLVSRVREYETMNCLRGITWCAMAWVQYQSPERPIRNPQTFQKIQAYLRREFLEGVRAQYFER